MRILFLVHNLGKTRHFERVIRGLTDRGHTVILAAARKRKPLKPTKSLHDDPRVEVISCPTRRVDLWQELPTTLRRARDYVRFFDPRYAQATKLATRAAQYAPEGWSAAIQGHAWLQRHWKATGRALALAETVLPPDRYVELFLRAERIDMLLVTPLVDFGSYQPDYVKAAHRLGIPAAFLPFSWDNLTNRGLIRVAPDRVLVWNEHQRREAIDLHHMPPERVVITGAARFDDFFEMRPSTSRAEFCGRLGLDPERPLVLYTCSSNFVAPREVDFVRQWIGALRAACDERVRACTVLVRPHPAHREQWDGVSLSDLPGVAIWSDKAGVQADQSLFDSLHHATAVVGLNTSAMIEAAIVERPVLTVLAPEFAGGQVGTLHFWYLLTENGGIVTTAENWDAHTRQLAAVLRDSDAHREQCRRFVCAFVRPRGIDAPVAPIVVDELDRLGKLPKQPRRTPVWHYPLRWALLAAAKSRAPRTR